MRLAAVLGSAVSLHKCVKNNCVSYKKHYPKNILQSDTFELRGNSMPFKGSLPEKESYLDNSEYYLEQVVDRIMEEHKDVEAVRNMPREEAKRIIECYNTDIFLENIAKQFKEDLGQRYGSASDVLILILRMTKNSSVRNFLDDVMMPDIDENAKTAASITYGCLNKYGINTTQKLADFLSINSDTNAKKYFSEEGRICQKYYIYSSLENKRDFVKFPELLLGLYDDKYNKAAVNGDKKLIFDPNPTLNFLKNFGVDSFDKFEERFSYLSDKFDGFGNIFDKIDAVYYLEDTFPEKIKILENVIKDSNLKIKDNIKDIYFKNNDVINYLFEKNGDIEGNISRYLPMMLRFNSFKPQVYEKYSSVFGNLDTPSKKLEIFDLLLDNNVSVDESNTMLKKSLVSDNEIINNFLRKEEIIKELASGCGISYNVAKAHYMQYCNFYSCIKNSAHIKTLYDFIGNFKVKNEASLLGVYNQINGTKNKNFTKEEFNNFIESVSYCDCSSLELYNQAKSRNILPIEMLKLKKESFDSVKDVIANFMANDDKNYFLGKTPAEIFKEYSLSDKTPEEVLTILNDAAAFNIVDAKDYEYKTKKISELAKYFDDRNSLLEFINKNAVNFSRDKFNEQYIDNCLHILDCINDGSEKSKERIKYYTSSKFICKSKNCLNEFFEKYKDKDACKNMFNMFADKKVPSIFSFNKFLNEYKDSNGETNNIVSNFQKMPDDIDFNKYKEKLALLNNKLAELNLPTVIDNKHILGLTGEDIRNKVNYNNQSVCKLLNHIYQVPEDGNFIANLPSTFVEKIKKFSQYQIAAEIIKNKGENGEEYANIIDLLKIDDIGKDACLDKELYVLAVKNRIKPEFLKLINSENWLYRNSEGKNANISLHARMRFIERFALEFCNDPEDLYTDETAEKLKDILRTIYEKRPQEVTGRENKVIKIHMKDIKAAFSKSGEMITIMARQ